MIRPELYKKTTDILFDAYFNDTLEHENCYACAVGNIIAAGLGIKILKDDSDPFGVSLFWEQHLPYSTSWPRDRSSSTEIPMWLMLLRGTAACNVIKAMEEIGSTGYSMNELDKIEKSFERARKGKSKDDWMFNGLVAVLEVLKEIHRVEDEHETQIQRFKNHYQCVTS